MCVEFSFDIRVGRQFAAPGGEQDPVDESLRPHAGERADDVHGTRFIAHAASHD